MIGYLILTFCLGWVARSVFEAVYQYNIKWKQK